MTGVWILVGACALAAVLALWRRRVDGRFRGSAAPSGPTGAEAAGATGAAEDAGAREPTLDAATWRVLGASPGERATLLQFSSAFCAPCRVTRVTLADVAGLVPGVAHVEVDAEQHLDVVRRLGILKTPTTLVLDSGGVEAARASGAPSRDQVLASLSRIVDVEST